MGNNIIDKDATIYKDVRLENCIIGPNCTIGDYCDAVNLVMDEKSELGRRNLIRSSKIGKGSYTGTNTIIKFTSIGKYSSLAWNLSIGGGNGDHDYSRTALYTEYWYKRTFNYTPPPSILDNNSTVTPNYKTHIGNDVWIGAGAQILSGLTIGDGCVIGAGAVVTKDVPPYCIVTGVPGTILKKRFDDRTINLLLKLKWWDWSEDKILENINFLRSTPYIFQLEELLSENNG